MKRRSFLKALLGVSGAVAIGTAFPIQPRQLRLDEIFSGQPKWGNITSHHWDFICEPGIDARTKTFYSDHETFDITYESEDAFDHGAVELFAKSLISPNLG